MKYLAPTAALALVATQASADSLETPEVETMIEVAEEQAASSADWIVPLLAVGMIAVILTNNAGSDGPPTPTPC